MPPLSLCQNLRLSGSPNGRPTCPDTQPMLNTQTAPTVPCPTCQTPVLWQPESVYRPFCSERCRLIDLGQWAQGAYSLPAREENGERDEY